MLQRAKTKYLTFRHGAIVGFVPGVIVGHVLHTILVMITLIAVGLVLFLVADKALKH